MKFLFSTAAILTVFASCPSLAQDAPDIAALRKQAENGDAQAQYRLGFDYHYGLGVKKDDTKAFEWWGKSAAQNYAPGEVMYGAAYADGWGVREDRAQTMIWYKKAADQDDGDAKHVLAAIYEFSVRDHAKALKLWQEALPLLLAAAQKGDAESECDLGTIYNMGWGVEKNDAESFKWRLKAAEQGNPDGEVAVSLNYRNGWGVAQDDAKATQWLIKSANHGELEAQKMLGEVYAKGQGAPKDAVKAYIWLTIALAQGYAITPEVIELAKTMSPAELEAGANASQAWQHEHLAAHEGDGK